MELQDKILILTGAYPPTVCGAADYLYKLVQTRTASDWVVYHPKNWKLRSVFKKLHYINSSRINIINLQYPTMGYDGSILPHILSVYYSIFTKKIFSVTIHECSQLSNKAKIAELLILFFANKVIFTNNFELEYAAAFVPFLRKKSKVIKIFTNIEHTNFSRSISERKYDLISFGLIRPEKGIEEFIQVSKELKMRNPDLKIILAGKIQPKFSDYSFDMVKISERYIDEIFYDKNEQEIAEILLNCKIAYLPFPDGISERRGSALAVFKTGGLIVTKKGNFTTKAFESCCNFVDDYKEAANVIEELLCKDNAFYEYRQKQNEIFLMENFPDSWDSVAKMYIDFLRA